MSPDRGEKSWNSRQRLLTALSGGIPDRVPINTYELAARNSSDWYSKQPSYRGLMEYIRTHTDCITNWNPQPVASGAGERELFLCSAHPVRLEKRCEPAGDFERTVRCCHTPKGPLQSVMQHTASVNTVWRVEHWCKTIADVDKALSVPYQPATYDFSDLGRAQAELGENGIILRSLRDPAYTVADLMSFQDFILWAYEHREHFARAVEVVSERIMENLQRELSLGVLDCYRIVGPEYFTPPYLPPAMFARFVLPHVKAMTTLIHSKGGKVRVHCHGNIRQVLDMILETGCDGIDPCEPPPDGDIELHEVKQRCQPGRVSVWGNIELKLLENGTTAEVQSAVADAVEQARDGGGFVLMPTAAPIHEPLSSRTEENYRVFIQTGLELGRY